MRNLSVQVSRRYGDPSGEARGEHRLGVQFEVYTVFLQACVLRAHGGAGYSFGAFAILVSAIHLTPREHGILQWGGRFGGGES